MLPAPTDLPRSWSALTGVFAWQKTMSRIGRIFRKRRETDSGNRSTILMTLLIASFHNMLLS